MQLVLTLAKKFYANITVNLMAFKSTYRIFFQKLAAYNFSAAKYRTCRLRKAYHGILVHLVLFLN